MKIKIVGNLSNGKEFYPVIYPESENEVNLLHELNYQEAIKLEEFVKKVEELKKKRRKEI